MIYIYINQPKVLSAQEVPKKTTKVYKSIETKEQKKKTIFVDAQTSKRARPSTMVV
jgi:demethoxyubiquinone hydroxylase (CLK1/Coq7/Cat5 family)